MNVRFHTPRRYWNEAGADGGLPGGAPAPAATPAAPAPAPAADGGNPAPAPAPANGAPAAPAPQPGSLMARGAAAAPAGSAPAGAPAPAGEAAPATIPEKYLVKKEDGSTDWEASALKTAQGYGELAKRFGGGEAPPQTPDGYAPDLPQGVSMEQLKTDPMFAGFLKGAHAVGLNNKQVSYLLGEFQQRVSLLQEQAADPATSEAELLQAAGLKPDTPFETIRARFYVPSYRGTQAFAADAEHAARIDKKFGSDPDFIRLMAKVGAELGEDRLPEGGLNQAETETLESLRKSAAYSDPKHPDHNKTVAQVTRLYQKLHPA